MPNESRPNESRPPEDRPNEDRLNENADLKTIESAFVLPFARVTAETLEQVSGKGRKCETISLPAEAMTKTQRMEVALRSHPEIRLSVEFGDEEASYFAQSLMGEPVGDLAERSSAVEEFWKQALGRASTALRVALRAGDLDLLTGEQPPWEKATAVAVEMTAEGLPALTLVIGLSAEALAFLSTAAAEPATEPAIAQPQVPEMQVSPDRQNLSLLLDVPLAVTLRFGERRMMLRDILKLTSGAVIELDRRTEEPVDLYLDERIIARGQVVVVDGCYGLRVTEVHGQPAVRSATEISL